ncbi:MAG: ABC transporter permease, partial [bacterium]|nr:ABC transporter permease [bacterium]
SPAKLEKALESVPGIKAYEKRIRFGAGLIKGMDELPCIGMAVEPEKDPLLFNIKQNIIEGSWLEAGDEQIVIGKDLADDIGLAVGDFVTLRMITSSDRDDFNWNAMDMEIKGIFDCGHPKVDSGWIIMPIVTAREGLALENEATEIVIRLDSDTDSAIASAQAGINASLAAIEGKYRVVSWKDLAGEFLAISESKNRNSVVIVMVILFIASMGIINTMLMAVMERTREIGMLTALGMKRKEIIRMFLYESGIIGVMGAVMGCLIGGLLSWYLEVYGFSLLAMGKTFSKLSASTYPVKDVFYAYVTADVLLTTFIYGTAVAVLAGLYPARKAADLDAVEALRHI